MADEEDRSLEEDSAGYLMSVSDMMAGLLFIFIVTLTAFIISFQAARNEFQQARSQAQQARDKAQTAVGELTDAQLMREQMLREIQQTLKDKYGVRVQVETEHGILRLTEKALTFPSGKADLPPDELDRLRLIAEVLSEVVPCYAANAPKRCDPAKEGELEAAFIEGHTDNVGVHPQSRYEDNLELSTARAAFTYRQLVGFNPKLEDLENGKGQPIFSVSGYGSGRPVNPHDAPTDDPANRRIDLRFIMAPPSLEDNEVVRELKEQGAG
jgi:flagellar motor protein MotB